MKMDKYTNVKEKKFRKSCFQIKMNQWNAKMCLLD